MPAGSPDQSIETATASTDATERRLLDELESATGNVRRLEDEYEAVLADPAVIQEDRDATRILLEAARDAAAAAGRAVERHRAGTYGRCARCGSEIPAERLEAVPEADTCVSCS